MLSYLLQPSSHISCGTCPEDVTEAGEPCRVFSLKADQIRMYPQADNAFSQWIDFGTNGFNFSVTEPVSSSSSRLAAHGFLSVDMLAGCLQMAVCLYTDWLAVSLHT